MGERASRTLINQRLTIFFKVLLLEFVIRFRNWGFYINILLILEVVGWGSSVPVRRTVMSAFYLNAGTRREIIASNWYWV